MTDTTSGAVTAYPSGAPEFTPVFQWGSWCSLFSFQCSILLIIACLFVPFLLAIVLSVLRIMYFDYPFTTLVSSNCCAHDFVSSYLIDSYNTSYWPDTCTSLTNSYNTTYWPDTCTSLTNHNLLIFLYID